MNTGYRPLVLLFVGLLVVLLIVPAQAKPQRIIALAPHITELLFAVGAGEQVVAVSDYSDYPLAAQALPRISSYASINFEAVLALQPDLVIAWRSGNPAADITRLQQLGVTVAFSDPLTLDDIGAELRLIGQLSGYPQQGEQQALQFEQQLEQLRRQYQHKKPVTAFFAMGTAPLSTIANRAWPQQILQLCAVHNPFANSKGDYPQVGIEQVIQAQPEVIIQPVAEKVLADFSYWRPFSALPAVKKNQYLSVNADYIYRTTPRTLLGITQLCQGVDAYR
ncbi:cobalamin-binding protein [Rheinheimera oceanensis]|uniref:cobalamin-binding protein n=1 Tax=Rheinheimera oceanensis TaxID=2817449 RepID=UPI0032E873C2